MKIKLDAQESDARIEILPLMDVIFCILTFFILAALQLTRQQGININLPKAQSGQPQLQQERLLVSVDMIGQTYIEDQAVSRDQLLSSLRSYTQQNPQGIVVLNAAKTASYNDVIQVLDLLRAVGGERVALATLPPASSEGDATAPGSAPNSAATPGGTANPGWSIPGQNTGPGGISAPILPEIPGGTTTPSEGVVPPDPSTLPGTSANP